MWEPSGLPRPLARRRVARLRPRRQADPPQARRPHPARVRDKLEELHADLTAGIAAPDGRYTVGQAIEDWLRDDLDGRATKTVTLYRGALNPFADHIGKKPLRELTAQDVRGVPTPK